MLIRLFILNDQGEPVACDDPQEWKRFMGRSGQRRIASTDIGATLISTVFLGMDRTWEDPPAIWETVVFGGPLDRERSRYTSRAEAILGHERMVARVRAKLGGYP